MNMLFTKKRLLQVLLVASCSLAASFSAFAQTFTVTKCSSPPGFSTAATGVTGTAVLPSITMVSGVDFPAGYVISNLEISVRWSKTQGTCAAPAAGPVPLAEVGFGINHSGTGTTRFFAASNANAPLIPAPGATWGGTSQILNVTTAFRDNAPALVIGNPPVNGTTAPNGHSLASLLPAGASADFLGDNPAGNWTLFATDDPVDPTIPLCVHEYCITFTLCPPLSLDAICRATNILSIGPGGVAFPNYQTLNNGSDTSCTLSSMMFAPAGPFTCAQVGSVIPITMTLTDRLGRTDACVTNVTIVDTVPPVIDCHNYTVYLSAAGSFTFVAADSISATDNCGLAAGGRRVNGNPSITFNCASAGLGPTVTLSAQDINGNVSSCPVQIFVLDTVPPTARCRSNVNAYLNGSGLAVVSATAIDSASSEVCPPIITRTINGNTSHTYTCANIGANPATLLVGDVFGNSSTCLSQVTVFDTVRPNALCGTITANLNVVGTVTVAATALDAGSTDNCGPVSFNIGGSPSISFNCSHVGTPQTVVLTVADPSGNTRTCNATVNVADVTPPTASCQNLNVFVNGLGTVTVTPTQVNAGSSDVCSGTTLTYLINGGGSVNFSCSNIGSPQNVTLTVTDQSGNSSTCAGTINVFDTISPTAVCAPISVFLNGAGTVSVTPIQVDGGSTDNCAITGRTINGLASVSFNCTHVAAAQAVTLRVTDAAGQFSECNTTVTVSDTVRPTANCQNATLNLNAGGTVTATPATINAGSSDACGIASTTINGGPNQVYNCNNLGANTATLTVTDNNGNTRSCTATITVADVTNPVAVCQNRTVYLSPTTANVTAAMIDGGSTDNCSIANRLINNQPSVNYTCANLGANTATLRVVDPSGNQHTCNATITVLDTVRPNPLCVGSLSVTLGVSGTTTVNATTINNASTDNCGGLTFLINGTATATYNCSHVATSPNTAVLTVTDASGNLSTCTSQINVQDIVDPTAVCNNGTFYVDVAGQVVVTAASLGGGSTDNCPPPSLTINGFVSPTHTYTCANLGNNTATIVAQDASGNTSVCSATVTVLDSIAPVANCNASFNAYIGAGGTVNVPASAINNGSTDNCGVASFNLSGSPSRTYTCANIGNNNETLNVLDASGNSASCITVITVSDTTRPTAICQNRTVTLSGTGTGSVTAAQINNGSSDNCGSVSLFLNSIGTTTINYTCLNVGPNTVTLIVRDPSGNQRTCTATVTVQDNTPPNALCQSGVNVFLNGAGTVTVTPAQINAGSTDNCGIATTTVSPNTFNCTQVGPQLVTLSLTDVNGNASSCNATITVQDTVRPTMVCQPITLTLSGAGTASLTPAMINGGTTDNCGTPTFLISESGPFTNSLSYTCADVGPHTVTLQATDPNGNTNTCNAIVTVQDITLPTAVCQNVSTNLGGTGTVTVLATQLNNGSTDNCSPLQFFINTVGRTDTTFNCATIGTHNLTLIVQDPSGNQATCNSSINIVDNTPPTAICQTGVQVFLNTSGNGTLTAAQINNGSADNCSVASISVAPNTFNCSSVGSQSVTLTVTDAQSNSSTCTTTITVVDTIRPTMVCNNTTIHLNAAGSATLLPAAIGSASTDACGIANLQIRLGASGPFFSSLLFNCTQTGPQSVTVRATDNNGNTNTCISTVTVLDTIRPNAICQNINADIAVSGTVTVLATDINNGSTDNCGVSNLFINSIGTLDTTFTCAQLGLRQLTLIVRDASGNQRTCLATVNVRDVLPPTAACQNPTVYLNGAGTVTVTPANVNNGSADNCASLTMTVAPNTFNCTNVGGVNNVVLTVTDGSGNSSTCNALVSVADTVRPLMLCKPDTAFLPGSGIIGVPAADVDGGTTDNCGVASLLIRRTSTGYAANALFTCADLGLQTVILRATDIYGNIDSCTSTVLVRDTVRPNIICNTPITLDLTPAGTLTVPATTFNNGSTDNCGPLTFLINNQPNISFNCASISSVQNLTLRATDAAGNFSTCAVQATIRDVTAPVANCQASITVNLGFSTGTATVNALTLNNGSTDACGPLSYLINGQSSFTYNCTHLGANTAVLTVTDGSGNASTCNTTVTVQDIHAPTANCLSNYTLPLTSNGTASLLVSSVNLNSTDNCGIVIFYQSSPAFTTVNYTCANLGNNILNVTMADASGNTANCVTVVQVIDNLAPIPDCFDTVQVFLNAAGSVTVPAIALDEASTDNCGIVTRLINGAATQQYTCLNLGVLPATLTVRDASNNSATCVAQVWVRDTIPPTANCNNVTANLSVAGSVTVNAASINASSTDNCAVTSILINGQPSFTYTCANVGLNTAVLSISDASGNTSLCNAQVTIQDITSPIINCTNPQVYLDPNGQAIVSPAQALSNFSDNCSIVSFSINGQPTQTYNCSQVTGFHPATISATDVGGNVSNCLAFVTVFDTIGPVAICNNLTVQLSPSTVTVNASQLANLSTDNCGIAHYSANGQPSVTFNCANVGTNSVLVVVSDSSNNVGTCIATVTVQDNIAPTANCVASVQAQLNSVGTATVNASAINNNSTDNCSPLTFSFINGSTTQTFNCSNVGANSVILLVTDPSGNQSFCNSTVNVVDITRPVARCQNITVYLNTIGTVTVQDVALNNTTTPSSDNCNVFDYHINSIGTGSITYTCANVGANVVNLLVQDPSNNYDTCQATITVLDTIAPTITCSGTVTFNLSNTGPFQLTPVQLGVSASDVCGAPSIAIAPDSITCANEGTWQAVITATDVNGNTNTCVSTVTVVIENPLPTTNADTTAPILCEGSTINLFANPPAGVYTYEWTGPNNFTSTAQDPVVTTNAQGVHIGMYYLEIMPTNGQGCPGFDSVEVAINVVEPPVLTVNSPLCEGYTAVIDIVNAGTYSGSSIDYAWSLNGAPITNNNSVLTINNVSLAEAGNYTVVVTVDGCMDSTATPFFVNVNALPAPATPAADTLCEGNTLTIFANPPAGNYTFQWSGPNGFGSTDENPVITNLNLSDQGIYTVVITNDSTCSSTATIEVLVKPLPVQPNISYNHPICEGEVLILTDTTNFVFPPDYVWILPTGDTVVTTIPQLLVTSTQPGTYTMYVDMGGCVSDEDQVTVVYEPTPVGYTDFFTVNFRDSIVGANVASNDSIPAGGFIISVVDSTQNGTVSIAANGTVTYRPGYSFFGYDTLYYSVCDASCPGSCDTAMVVFFVQTEFECFIPDAISPNGDGINDTWNIRCVNEYPNAELRLFSRWGNLVYQGPLAGFNGQFNGRDLPDGSYFYVLKLNDTTHVPKDRYSGYLIIQR